MTDRYEDAIEIYDYLIDEADDVFKSLFGKALALFKSGNYNDAYSSCSQALDIDPNNTDLNILYRKIGIELRDEDFLLSYYDDISDTIDDEFL